MKIKNPEWRIFLNDIGSNAVCVNIFGTFVIEKSKRTDYYITYSMSPQFDRLISRLLEENKLMRGWESAPTLENGIEMCNNLYKLYCEVVLKVLIED